MGDRPRAAAEDSEMTDDLRHAARVALACLDLTSLGDADTPAEVEADRKSTRLNSSH